MLGTDKLSDFEYVLDVALKQRDNFTYSIVNNSVVNSKQKCRKVEEK